MNIGELKNMADRLSDKHEKLKNFYISLNTIFDTAPVMIWEKDMENKFVMANKEVMEKLLLTTDEENILGKTGVDIAGEIISRGIEYSAGWVCGKSDDITKEKGATCVFLEDFIVAGKPMYLLVKKTPLYNPVREMIGTIGVGIDLTETVLDHKNILGLYLKAKNMLCKEMHEIFGDDCHKRFPNIFESFQLFEEAFEAHINKHYFSEKGNNSKLISINEQQCTENFCDS